MSYMKDKLTELVISNASIAARLILEGKIDYRVMFYSRDSLKQHLGLTDIDIDECQRLTSETLVSNNVDPNLALNADLLLALRKATLNLLCGWPIKGGDRITPQEVAVYKLAQEFEITSELPLFIHPVTDKPY